MRDVLGKDIEATPNLGSTRMVLGLDSTVNVLADFFYLPSGDFANEIPPVENVETPVKFTGKELDDEGRFGLYYFGARYYDPFICRWMAPDPAGQFASPYSYVGGNMMAMVDPNGKIAFMPILISAAISAGFNATLQGLYCAYGIQNGFDFASFAGSAVSGGVAATLGQVASASWIVNNPLRYTLKAARAGIYASASSWAGQFTTDLLDDGKYNYSRGSYGKANTTAAISAIGMSILTSTIDYFDWDKYSPQEKIEILKKEFGRSDFYYDPTLKRSDELAYFDEATQGSYFGKYALIEKGGAFVTAEHEIQHFNDYNLKGGYKVPMRAVHTKGTISSDFMEISFEQRAYLRSLTVASKYNLPGYMWDDAKRYLIDIGKYKGPIPKTYGLKQVWFNLF